jgi:RNA polymerase-binding transcription factor DksA
VGKAEVIRERLEQRLEQLSVRTKKIQADLRSPSNKDWTEHATEAENDEVLERLDEAELAEMREIRSALVRIEHGTYGMCRRCGTTIPPPRLEILPFTSVCVGCAA